MAVDVLSPTKPSHRASWGIVTILACAHFALSYTTSHRQFLHLAEYAQGLERTPYQYRVLMAWILRPLAGSSFVDRLAGIFPGPLKDPYLLVEAGIVLLTLLGAVLATRRSLQILTGHAAFSAWASLLVVYMAHFQFSLIYGLNYILPYDVPGVMFFCLALLGIVSGNRLLYYAAFAVGTLNRETMIFAMVPFAVWGLFDGAGERAEGGWARILPHLLVQVALWGAVKFVIARSFAGRPYNPQDSGLFEIHLAGNVASILKPYQWPLLASSFGFALPLTFALRDKITDARVRKALFALVPLWIAAMLVVGVFVEIRVFGELIALMALGTALALYGLLRPSLGVAEG